MSNRTYTHFQPIERGFHAIYELVSLPKVVEITWRDLISVTLFLTDRTRDTSGPHYLLEPSRIDSVAGVCSDQLFLTKFPKHNELEDSRIVKVGENAGGGRDLLEVLDKLMRGQGETPITLHVPREPLVPMKVEGMVPLKVEGTIYAHKPASTPRLITWVPPGAPGGEEGEYATTIKEL